MWKSDPQPQVVEITTFNNTFPSGTLFCRVEFTLTTSVYVSLCKYLYSMNISLHHEKCPLKDILNDCIAVAQFKVFIDYVL